MKQIATSLKLFKPAFFVLAAVLFSHTGWSQVIFSNAITDNNPSAANPFTAGQTTDPNITASGIGRGTGIAAVSAQNRYAASGFTTANAIDLADYFEFTLTPANNFEIDFTSIVYTGQASGTGPTQLAFRSSVDGFTTNVGTPTVGGTTIPLSGSQFQDIAGSITFRLYGFNAGAAGGTFSVNDFTFNGVVSSTALSVDLLSFSANTTGRITQLSWTTSCASATKSFAVEHSSDGQSFTEAGRVDATVGECNNTTRAYKFEAPASNGLYRLAMHDGSGRVEYSRTVSVLYSNVAASGNITVYPSLATASLNIRGLKEGETCRIVDLAGRTLQSWKATGSNETVSLSGLPAGAYMLVADRSGEPMVQRFWKQ